MSEIIFGIDMNNSSTNVYLDKRFCKNYGKLCELATDFGYCQLTVCIKHNFFTNCDADMRGEKDG